MDDIKTIDPNDFVCISECHSFQIYFITDIELLSWTKRGFQNAELATGSKNIEIFRRDEIVNEYYTALTEVRQMFEQSFIGEGFLQIIELRLFFKSGEPFYF